MINIQILRNSVSIHHNKIHTEIDEWHIKLIENTHYNLRHTSQFLVDPIHSVFIGSESASYLGPKIWEQIPFEIKNINSLVGFKKEIRKRKPANCPCSISKVYTPNLGFI